jgi:hypothetical protein
MLDKDQSFSLTANVTAPGYQRVALKGFLVDRRRDGTYVAPLIPQLFYGVDGLQLSTWRQYLPAAGSQAILSRGAGGYPEVPREELYWRKVSDFEEPRVEAPVVEAPIKPRSIFDWWNGLSGFEKVFIAGTAFIAVMGAGVFLATRGK